MTSPWWIGAFVVLIGYGCVLVRETVPMDREEVLDGILWSMLWLRHPKDYRAYRNIGMPYARVREVRARGWVASTIEDVLRAHGRWQTHSPSCDPRNRPCEPGSCGVLLVMTPESFAAFTGAGVNVWAHGPARAQDWFDALGQHAPLPLAAGLSLPEALALDRQGRLDEDMLATLAALRLPEVAGRDA